MKAAKILIAWTAVICAFYGAMAIVFALWGPIGIAYSLGGLVLLGVLWAAWQQGKRADAELARRTAEMREAERQWRTEWNAQNGVNQRGFRRPRGAA